MGLKQWMIPELRKHDSLDGERCCEQSKQPRQRNAIVS
jgi:hypothetical protein